MTYPPPLSPADFDVPEAVGEEPAVAVPLAFDCGQVDTTNLSKSSQLPLSSTLAMVTLC